MEKAKGVLKKLAEQEAARINAFKGKSFMYLKEIEIQVLKSFADKQSKGGPRGNSSCRPQWFR